MSNLTVRIGGVPEHFNLPIHLAHEQRLFSRKGITMEWTTFRGGTGQMTKALRQNDIDICVLLTEGILADIARGNPSKIIGTYVTSPLVWGIHTGAQNELKYYEEIFDKRYAISRFGSGSHLMAIVDAHAKGHVLDNEQFRIIKNLEGALDSLTSLESDVFYWEKFMTKPHVDSGQLRRIGEYLTPWPCFVLAARTSFLDAHAEAVVKVLQTIYAATEQFMLDEEMINLVSIRYGISPADAAQWYHMTNWATNGWIDDKMLKNVYYHLKLAGILTDSAVNQGLSSAVWLR